MVAAGGLRVPSAPRSAAPAANILQTYGISPRSQASRGNDRKLPVRKTRRKARRKAPDPAVQVVLFRKSHIAAGIVMKLVTINGHICGHTPRQPVPSK